jgi:casein kinase I family protein HRR25
MSFANNNIDIETAYRLGIELIKNLQIMHDKGILHVDIKEDNFVSLPKPKKISNIIMHFALIDYGFSAVFQNNAGIHYEPCIQLKKCGNYYYASINALLGNPISRKDDMISAIYLILYWCSGSVPWKNIVAKDENDAKQKILEIKKAMNMKRICSKKYDEINEIYDDINSLSFKQRPNYDKYIELLKKKIYKCEIGKNKKKFFIWDEILLNKFNDNIKNKKFDKDNQIKDLFTGYPDEFISSYLYNYYN